jgi:hypothetical protein
MLLGLSNPAWLRSVLPVLSDALNEVGYPWEFVALDASDNPTITEVLAPWSQRPGFRSVVLPAQTSAAQLLTTESGMAALGAVARWAGDVTLLDRAEVELLLSDR